MVLVKYNGIFTALATPYDAEGKLNLTALERLVEYNISMGVAGFFVCGSSAEAFLLTLEERRQIMHAVARCVAGRVTLIAHVGCISTEQTAALARYAGELGYDAVSSVAPFYHKFTFPEMKAYFEKVADAAGLPMFVYNIPTLTGVQFTTEQLCQLLADDRILGIKHTSGDHMQLRQMKTAFPDKIIFNGFDETFLAGLVMGADGAIGSNFNFMADKFVKIHALFRQGKLREAMLLQEQATKIITVIYRYGLSQSIKAILKAKGIDCGVCREPFGTLTPEDEKALMEQVLPML